ncbi:hypothetical protein SAPIO_CDS4876 [Scedosporium apiospermum]|uniref:Uncharacterized protein n=1 Tax=Pseudallescheria apiosperma TaxID=563466 RepID=A0A084G790_PSEDA|nr:uncharacterized protein SAPIO_CDS4876 [Scedosporium apiospermum]KEZ43202.1 hypothetical protein SAPIO_CDS4876 [Scedosporium apiospermum]
MSVSSNSNPEASARLDSAFQRALAKFKTDSLTEKEGDEFQWGTLDELKASIEKIQDEQVSKNKNRNLNRVKAFLEGMQQYEEIVKVFLNTCNYLAFVWGPMKFLLQVTSNFVNAFDALLDMYNEIGEQLGLLGKYQSLFCEKPHMMNVLEMIYVDILEFHAKALSYFRQKLWKQLFRHTWKNFRTRFNDTIQNFKRHKSLIESQATLAQFEEICSIRKQQAEQLTFQREEAVKRRAQAVRAWLAAESMTVHQDHFSALRHEYPGSGEWILKKNRVRQWLDVGSAAGPLLWLTGIPGAGKTFLASTLIEELQKRTGVHVLFFYCKYETVGRNSFMDIARSLLQQCCLGDERLQEYIEAKSSGEDTLRKSQAKELLDVAIRRKNRAFIIIDGIDECKKEEKVEIVSWLRGIVAGDCGASDSDEEEDVENEGEETAVRGLIVGQEDNDSWRLLRDLPVVKIEPGDNEADILRFCRDGESKIKARFETGSLDVAETVAKYAAGMFLFARLVMSNLRTQISQYRFEQEMKWVTEGTVVDKITEKLELAYGRIITRVITEAEEAEREGALQLLGIMVSAQRDLAWHEIQGLLAVDLASRLIDVKRHMSVDSKDLCGSLVEVRSGQTVTLVHTSAEHYLVKRGIVNVGRQHVNMARICLGYLSMAPFDPALTTNEIYDLLKAGHYAFAFYALAHWLDHLEKAAESLQHAKKPEDLQMEPLLEEIEHFLENNYQSPIETSAEEKSQVGRFEPFEVFGESGHMESLTQARHTWLEFTGRDEPAELLPPPPPPSRASEDSTDRGSSNAQWSVAAISMMDLKLGEIVTPTKAATDFDSAATSTVVQKLLLVSAASIYWRDTSVRIITTFRAIPATSPSRFLF